MNAEKWPVQVNVAAVAVAAVYSVAIHAVAVVVMKAVDLRPRWLAFISQIA